MSEIISLLPAFFAGIILGVIFFGGLWLTVSHGLRAKKSIVIFVGSFMVRMVIILLGFYYVGANDWRKMLVCLSGFLIARFLITRITTDSNPSNKKLVSEVSDET